MAGQSGQTSRQPAIRAARWAGLIVGIGLIGAVDEIVFHQLLQWHNFYVHSTVYWRVFSDGLFHVFTTAMLFLGALHLWTIRHRIAPLASNRPFWMGILLGAGAFQLFDGTVNHKILKLHPIREGAQNMLPYDIAWIAFALLLLVLGWIIRRDVQATGIESPTHAEASDQSSSRPG